MIKLYHNLLDILKIYVRIENTLQRVIYMKNKYKLNPSDKFNKMLNNMFYFVHFFGQKQTLTGLKIDYFDV